MISSGRANWEYSSAGLGQLSLQVESKTWEEPKVLEKTMRRAWAMIHKGNSKWIRPSWANYTLPLHCFYYLLFSILFFERKGRWKKTAMSAIYNRHHNFQSTLSCPAEINSTYSFFGKRNNLEWLRRKMREIIVLIGVSWIKWLGSFPRVIVWLSAPLTGHGSTFDRLDLPVLAQQAFTSLVTSNKERSRIFLRLVSQSKLRYIFIFFELRQISSPRTLPPNLYTFFIYIVSAS